MASQSSQTLPLARVDVVERGTRARARHVPCIIGRDVEFSTEPLESYCLTKWEPVAFDALLLAAAVEFCDRTQRRPSLTWARRIELQIAVHEPDRWSHKSVSQPLHEALELLTGDRWNVSFAGRREPVSQPRQMHFHIPTESCAVIPFSDGLDSRAVAGLVALAPLVVASGWQSAARLHPNGHCRRCCARLTWG